MQFLRLLSLALLLVAQNPCLASGREDGDAESQYHLGCLLENQGRHEEAEKCYYQSAEQEYSPAQHKVGFCLEKKGHFSGALNNYEKASNLGYKLAYLSLALTFYRNSRRMA